MKGKNVSLVPTTNALWHEFWKGYVADPMMSDTQHVYDPDICEEFYRDRMADATRKYFSVMHDGKVVGYIYLKHMDRDKKSSEFGIAMMDDSVKGKGYGTEAIWLLAEYAFNVLGLETIIATAVLRNVRSQHVLTKMGFVHTHSDGKFNYYKLDIAIPIEHDLKASAAEKQLGQVFFRKTEGFSTKFEGQCETELL